MESSNEKTSAEIQREIDQDRERIGSRIDAIPGADVAGTVD